MKLVAQIAFSFAVLSAISFAQEDLAAVHRDDFARWSRVTTLTPVEIHQMWRSMSHYAQEADDDSSIELLDIDSLATRKQILMITGAGMPHCVVVAVFDADRPHRKIWQEDQGPSGHGFCDRPGSPADIKIDTAKNIRVNIALNSDDPKISAPVFLGYTYKWNGTTYAREPVKESAEPRSEKRN